MKKNILIIAFICSLYTLLVGEEITTANVFFSEMSELYGKIRDYTANLLITTGTENRKQTMEAVVSFKRPNRLRMDFTRPAEQVILFTGETLTIFLPAYRMVLNQSMDKTGSTSTLATPQGLSLLKRSYTIAYETGSAPQPLQEGSSETVVVLSLQRRSANETFRRLRLLVSPSSKLIRRIEAWPISGSKITFDFYNYHINTGIPNTRFLYDIPPNADMLNNFLFEE